MDQISLYRKILPALPRNKRQACQHQAGISLLCLGLKEQYGLEIPPEDLDYRRKKGNLQQVGLGERGKPYLLSHPEIHFNLSNTEGLVVCALGSQELGIDLEMPHDVSPALLRRVLTEEEIACLQ